MPTVPIETAVAHCAALGFDGLELTVIPGWTTDAALLDAGARRRIRALYDDHQLELCGLSGNVPLLAPGNDPVNTLAGYLDLAAGLQRPGERMIVTTTSGSTPDRWEAEKFELVERIGKLAGHAERIGTMVGIEPHVGAALHRPEQAIWLIEQVNSPALTIHFDISHFNVQGFAMEG